MADPAGAQTPFTDCMSRCELLARVLHKVYLQHRNIRHSMACRLTPVMELISARPPAFDATAVTIFSMDRLHHLPGLCAFQLVHITRNSERCALQTIRVDAIALQAPVCICSTFGPCTSATGVDHGAARWQRRCTCRLSIARSHCRRWPQRMLGWTRCRSSGRRRTRRRQPTRAAKGRQTWTLHPQRRT